MSIINQANQNSSLVNSLMDATASITNPFEYAIEKQTPFHGLQYIKHTPTNESSFGASSSVDFDLTKVGFLRSVVFSWDTTAPQNNSNCPPSGTLNCIDRIELLSASRRLAVMDRHALKAALSDLPNDVRSNYYKGLHMLANGKQLAGGAGADGTAYPSYLFIPMSFFCNVKNSLPLNFVEPVKLRVVMTDLAFGVHDTTTDVKKTFAVSNPRLYGEYRILDPEAEDATIERNYDNVLTQLNYDYHTEVEATGTLTSSANLKLDVEIKDPGVVSAAYVIVQCDYQDVHTAGGSETVAAANMIAAEQPLILSDIQFKASGQDIIPSMPARILELYGRRTLASEFHACGFGPTYMSNEDAANFHNVYKIDFGLDGDNRYNSGGCSMRELNTPTISVVVRMAAGSATADEDGGADEGQGTATGTATAVGSDKNPHALNGKKVKCRVILKKHTLISTDPASGRMVQAISN